MRPMPAPTPRWPTSIADESQLDDLLSAPTPAAIDAMRELEGDLVVLGVAGKMGPTLARMARRASDAAGVTRRVIGVSRFTEAAHEEALQAHGVETIRCDLLDEAAVARLPDAPLVVYMAGRKFGSTGLESLTWAMNAWLPAVVCRRYAGSRIAAFSTGNVYGLTPVGHGGSQEGDAAVARRRVRHELPRRANACSNTSAARNGTAVSILRLNYATEMRYGLLVDLARKVAAGTPIELAMGHANVIWQGDANAMSLVALRHASSPPYVVNIAGREELSVRDVCLALGARLGREVQFTGAEADDALLSNGSRGWADLGEPQVDARATDRLDGRLGRARRRRASASRRISSRATGGSDVDATVRAALDRGLAIPAHPLALTPTASSTSDGSARSRATTWPPARAASPSACTPRSSRSGAPDVGLFEPVLALAREEMDRADAAQDDAARAHRRRVRRHAAGLRGGRPARVARLPRRPAQPRRARRQPTTTRSWRIAKPSPRAFR